MNAKYAKAIARGLKLQRKRFAEQESEQVVEQVLERRIADRRFVYLTVAELAGQLQVSKPEILYAIKFAVLDAEKFTAQGGLRYHIHPHHAKKFAERFYRPGQQA